MFCGFNTFIDLVLSETGALFFDNKKRENESSSRKIYILMYDKSKALV